MEYTKPYLRAAAAMESIQKVDKDGPIYADSIDPNSPTHYLTAAAYEADE